MPTWDLGGVGRGWRRGDHVSQRRLFLFLFLFLCGEEAAFSLTGCSSGHVDGCSDPACLLTELGWPVGWRPPDIGRLGLRRGGAACVVGNWLGERNLQTLFRLKLRECERSFFQGIFRSRRLEATDQEEKFLSPARMVCVPD